MGASRATRGRTAAVVGVALVALVTSACGSGTGRAAPARAPHVATAPVPAVSPCGPGTPVPSRDIGVTADTVTVGVVADITGPRALFTANWQAMQAFAAYCNAQGGIAGRRLVVQPFDTALFNHRQAITDSCASVFALVGSASVFDGDGASVETDCGIPDVPALVAEPGHERVPTVVSPLPSPQQLYLVGPLRYLARVAPAAVRRAGMAYLDVGVTALRSARQVEASRAVGYRFVTLDSIPAITQPSRLAAAAARMVEHRVGYVTVQGATDDLAGIQKALLARGYTPTVVDAGPLFYDPRYPRTAGAAAEGTYVLAQTVPLDEGASVPELARYEDWLQRAVPGAEPTAQGVRSWSAGLLFAEAARRAANHLDRTTLLARLRAIHRWDGNGIQVPTDPGAGLASTCFAYVRVRNGAFVREYPERGFACPRDGWMRLRRDPAHL
jgi:ABC-type branched-subunit amino acid transport system substrate-binding protein